MKDVVFLVVDSLMANYVFSDRYGQSTTPNLDKIKGKCLFFNHIFAQGPYTEAGTRGLLTGERTLENEGYFLRYHKANTFITNIFKDFGYETYSLIYPTTLYSDWIFSKLDHVLYTSEFIYDVFWTQKFSHYIEYSRNGTFDCRDMQDCIDLFEIIFTGWMHFLNPQNVSDRILLRDYDNGYDYKKYYSIVKQEYAEFILAPEKYVENYLTTAPEHPLNTIRTELVNQLVNHDAVSEAFSCCPEFEKHFRRKQLFLNIKNNPVTLNLIKNILNRKKSKNKKENFGEIINYIKLLKRSYDCSIYRNGLGYKPLLSAHTQIQQIGKILVEPHDVPVFITAHVEEPHYFTTFFSYDSNDSRLITEELYYAKEYVDSVNNSYRGLLSYDLAVRYVDKQIGELIESLRKAGRIENTVICIVADHGSSYNSFPHRKNIVNNCHTENYRIPLIIYSDNINGFESNCIASNIDVLPTLIDFLNLPIPNILQGRSLIREDGLPHFAITEYMGPGCPDMRRNYVRMTIRNEHYLIAFEGSLLKPFTVGCITDIYDLKNDPLELNNIYGLRNRDIDELLIHLQNRFEEIVLHNQKWLIG